MPLTPKGRKILKNLTTFYKGKKGEEVFRKMIAEKKITGAEVKKRRPKKRVK